MPTYCKHCGHGKWNPETGTRLANFWVAQDETTDGIQVLWEGKVVIDIAMGTIRVHDMRARFLAYDLAEWLGDGHHVVKV